MDRLEAMSIFIAVVEAGSLSAASRRLHIPLATVSRKISELEAHLKARLLTRSNRQMVPTEAGRPFLVACRRIVQDVDAAEREASGEYQMPKGELLLTAPIALGRLYLLPIVTDFLKEHPGIDVRLALADRRLNLVEDRIDVALRAGTLRDSSLVATKVGAIRRLVCASPAYLARRGTPTHPGDLKDHDLITFENTVSSREWTFIVGKRTTSVPVRSRLVVSTAEAAVDAAVLGLGLAHTIDYQIHALRRAGELTVVLETFMPPAYPVYLIYDRSAHLPSKTRTFLDYATVRLKKALRALAESADSPTLD
jgi:DNA-binding transcriptional LysR family regulator